MMYRVFCQNRRLKRLCYNCVIHLSVLLEVNLGITGVGWGRAGENEGLGGACQQ